MGWVWVDKCFDLAFDEYVVWKIRGSGIETCSMDGGDTNRQNVLNTRLSCKTTSGEANTTRMVRAVFSGHPEALSTYVPIIHVFTVLQVSTGESSSMLAPALKRSTEKSASLSISASGLDGAVQGKCVM